MRLVPRADAIPHHCIVYPHLGQEQREGFVDTGTVLTVMDPHVYVSVVAVKEMAALVGLVDGEDYAKVVGENRRLSGELDKLKRELESRDREFEAIDVLVSKGYQARKKPGRPRKDDDQ